MSSTDAASAVVHSPLPFLIAEERHRDGQATEALFLSFNIDYGFFETAILGTCRYAGARVTLVGDASITAPDPRAARDAGITYIPGLAAIPGAFHPKVVVLAGPQRAVVAIGSGNLSAGGWQHNSEVWTVAEVANGSVPAWVIDLAAWLDALPGVVAMSPRAGLGVERAARQLTDLTVGATIEDTGHRLVDTSRGTIVSQLPPGPVDELLLYAPFHDPREAAIEALITHFSPSRVRLSIQPHATVLQADALRDLVNRHGVTLVEDAGADRYRHGKLVEWARDGRRWALTGSANLSAAALLRSLSEGGNCEVGLIAPIAESMFPEGPDLDATTVLTKAISTNPDSLAHRGPTLLSASIEDTGLRLTLAHPAPANLDIEASPRSEDPDNWTTAGTVPLGATTCDIPIDLPGGSRVRLVAIADDGDRRSGNTVFVVHPRYLRPVDVAGKSARRFAPSVGAIFEDISLATEYVHLLESLAMSVAATRLPSSIGSGNGRERPRAHTSPDDNDEGGWLAYLDSEIGRVGPHLIRLALPGLTIPSFDTVSGSRLWDDLLVDDAEAGLAEDTAEVVDDTSDSPPSGSGVDDDGSAITVTPVPPADAARFRATWKRLSKATGHLPLLYRISAIRILLLSTATGGWDLSDDDCFSALADATGTLPQEPMPANLEAQAGSMAAVALTLMQDQTPFHNTNERTLRWRAVADTVSHLLAALDPELISAYCHGLRDTDGVWMNTDVVIATAERIVDDNPLHDAAHLIEEHGWHVHPHGRNVLHVEGSFGNPALAAFQAIGYAEEAPLAGVWATNTKGNWALVAWSAPDLIRAEPGRAGTLWRHYRLEGLIGPSALAAQLREDPDVAREHEVKRTALVEPFPEALDLVARLGLTDVHPPEECE